MASGLIGAALASGFGQGLSNAAQTGMQIMGASMLQKERLAADERRMAIMEKYAAEREGRGYAHQETMLGKQQDFARGQQQEQFGQNQLSADLAVGRAETAAERERTRQRDPNTITADAKAEEERYNATSGVRVSKRKDELGWSIEAEATKAELLAGNKNYLESVAKIKDASQTEGDRAESAMKVLQLQQSKEGESLKQDYVSAVKSGDQGKIATTKKAFQAFSEKPWEDDKLTAKMASDGLRESGNEIVRLSAQMKDVMPGSAEAAALQRRLQTAQDSHDAYDTILKTRLGLPGQSPKKGPDFANFKDPMKPDTLNAGTPAPTVPSPARTAEATNYLATKREEVAQRAGTKREQTQQDAMAAMEAERPGMVQATGPLREGPQPPVTANLPRELPRANAPAVASTPLPGMERQKLAMEQPKGTGMVAQAGPVDDNAYDYEAAKKAGVVPKPDPNETEIDPKTGQPYLHWDSKFKGDSHFHRFLPSEMGIYDTKNNRLIPQDDFERVATPRQRETVKTEKPLAKAEVQGYLANAEEPNTKEPMADVQTPAKDGPYEDLIQKYSAEEGVDPNIIRAQMRRESDFNPAARGKAGEIGLMQTKPDTANDMGVATLDDPANQVKAGVKYYAWLKKRYNGDDTQALTAYNFGIGNLEKGYPVPETTKKYVASILAEAKADSGPTVKTAVASAETPSYMDVLQKLPGKTRDYVTGQIDEALSALKSGQITEEQFTGRILAAWTSVPGSPGEYTTQARALAKGLIAEAKGPR